MSIKLTFSKPRMVLDVPAYFPNVIKLRSGELFVQLMWGDDRRPNQEEYEDFYAFDKPTTAEDWQKYNDKHHTDGKYVHVLSGNWAKSTDGGKTFEPTCLPPIIEYTQLDNGDVIGLQWYTYHDKDGNPVARSWTSHDGCKSWDAPYDIPMIAPPFEWEMNVPHRRIIPLGGESFLVLVYGRLKGDKHDRSMVFRTIDNFKTLHYYSTCGMWHEGIENPAGLNETDMVRTNDGRLLCVMRNESFMPMWQTHSIDDGATWTPVVRFPERGVDPALCKLQNGVIVCSYGRPGVNVMFSEDNGDNWEKRSIILLAKWEQDGSDIQANQFPLMRSCSYTDVVETSPNTATVFYSAPADWNDDPAKTPWNIKERKDFRIYAVDVKVEKE